MLFRHLSGHVRAFGGAAGPRKLSLVLRGRTGAGLALLLSAAIYGVHVASQNPPDAPLLLLIVPVGLCAVTFGLTGGLVSASLAFAAMTATYVHEDLTITAVGYLSGAAALFVFGPVVGRFADERRSLERVVSGYRDLTHDLLATLDFEGSFKLGGSFTQLNPAWSATLGWTNSQLTSRPFLDFVHPDDREATLEAAMTEGELTDFQNRCRCIDGSYRWLEWTSRVDGEAKLAHVVGRDVTPRKEAERAIAEHAVLLERAVAVRTIELQARTSELDEARLETMQRLALAAEFRDDDTFQHTKRVGATAALLAERLGIPPTEIPGLREAAPLHDIGKLTISDAVLLKPGKLTAEELVQMREHAVAGATILSGSRSSVLQLGEEIALAHHEWWDGSGYPNGLAGEEIPISGRIVALADVFDALTHDRPYKSAWSLADAVDEIRRLSGAQFDPRVVNAFETLDHHALVSGPSTPAASSRTRSLEAVAS